jgi:hypothetical protein
VSVASPPLQGQSYEQFYEASSPRACVRINAANVYALQDFEVDLNTHGATSSASVALNISGNPDFSSEFKNFSTTAATAEIFVGLPTNPTPSNPPSTAGLQRVYYGLIAQYDAHFTENLVTFELRSLASPLVDEKIQQVAIGATTVDFIASVCARFGLGFVPLLGNKPLRVQEVLGEMYVGGSNFSAAIHGMRIWDLILQCAQFDNVDAWEDEGTVFYCAPSLIARQTIDLKYGRDLPVDGGFIGSHSLVFSKEIQVEVRSDQPRVSQSNAVRYVTNADSSISVTMVSKTTTGSPVWGTPDIVSQTILPNGTVITDKSVSGGSYSTKTSLGTESPKMRYIYYPRNKDAAYCNAFAITQWRKISQLEYTGQMRFPLTKAKGIIPLTALLRVHGLPYSKFNTTYYPRKLMLSGGKDKPFMYEIDAVNHELPQGSV